VGLEIRGGGESLDFKQRRHTMPRTQYQWETFFKGGGKMTKELMREFNETFERERKASSEQWPSEHFVPMPPDAKTLAEANEVQGLNKKRKEGETLNEIIKRARVAVSERDMDPYCCRLVHQMRTDIFGDDWRNLDIVRGRFVEDHDLIVDLLKVVDRLTDRKESKKRKCGDTDSE
jgi:hypothetical protein